MKWNVLRLLKHELDYKNSEKTEWNGGSSKEIFPSSPSSFLCSLFFGITVWKREEIEVLYSTRFYVKWRKKRRGFSKWWRFAERCNPWCNCTSTGTAFSEFSLFDIPLPARKLELLTVLRNGSHKQQKKIVNFFKFYFSLFPPNAGEYTVMLESFLSRQMALLAFIWIWRGGY